MTKTATLTIDEDLIKRLYKVKLRQEAKSVAHVIGEAIKYYELLTDLVQRDCKVEILKPDGSRIPLEIT